MIQKSDFRNQILEIGFQKYYFRNQISDITANRFKNLNWEQIWIFCLLRFFFPENFTPRDAHCFWQWASKNISALTVRISLISPKVMISRFTKRSLTPKVTLDRVKVTSQCIPLWSNMCAKLIITYRWILTNSITSHLIMSALKPWCCQDEIYFAAISVCSLP